MDIKVGSPTAVPAFMSVVSDHVQSRMGLRNHAEDFLINLELKNSSTSFCFNILLYNVFTRFVIVICLIVKIM
jgi:hypothetical protein